MNKINRVEFIDKIAEDSGLFKKDIDTFLDSFARVITNELSDGNTIALKGFGNFEVRERSARNGVNPRTGEAIIIGPLKFPAFKPSKAFRDLVNGGTA